MNPDTVCSEIWREESVTESDILEYAPKIGINVTKDPHLLYLAREALNTKLPDYWKPCLSEEHGEWYYFNTVTGESQWEHPVDGWYRRVIRQSRGDHDDDDKGELDHSEEDSDPTICDELTPHSQIPTKGNPKDDGCSDRLSSLDQTSTKPSAVQDRVHITGSSPSTFDLRMDERLEKLRQDLAAEMSEELRKLRLHVSERFHNMERRKHYRDSSDLGPDMRLAQRHHEKCLRREMELNMTALRDQMLLQMPNKSLRDGISSNFERKDLIRSKSHASLLSFHESDSCYESSYSGLDRSVIFSRYIRLNLESLEDLKRRVDCLELSNQTKSIRSQNDGKILPEPEDELLSAKLWLLNRSKEINKEKS